MNIGEKAFKELFPRKRERRITVNYSKRFKDYNANITYTNKEIKFGFAHEWKTVSEEIQIGLAQHLLLKAFKEKKRTINIELYEKFMEKLAKYAKSDKNNPELEESFHRINKEYFHDFMEQPGLEWGTHSTTQLGTYSYHSDTIRISKIFQGLDVFEQWLLDYVMYHELLHKKFGLKHKGGSCRHHPPEFRKAERKFKVLNAEKKLSTFVNRARRTKPRRVKPKVQKQSWLRRFF